MTRMDYTFVELLAIDWSWLEFIALIKLKTKNLTNKYKRKKKNSNKKEDVGMTYY